MVPTLKSLLTPLSMGSLMFLLATEPAEGLQQESSHGVDFPAEKVAFFEQEVRPILEQHCFQCHGSGERVRGGLRMTSREGLLRGGDLGPAVVLDRDEPPSRASSTFLEAIHYDGLEMPPRGKLEDEQIAILTRWVAMGVPWSPHADHVPTEQDDFEEAPYITDEDRAFWAFQPVERPAIPEVADPDWVANPIDAFVLATLEEFELPPATPASKRSLIRRLSYDLTGLPPTPEEVEAFVADDSSSAYSRLVERLLDSPRYGERWARHWLDLVRFAETNSYERDSVKPFAWRYRDYVIRAFCDDKPFDQFIREQLAGDEFAKPTAESITATGYYRLGIWDDEPTDPLQARYDGLDDIVKTTAQTFLGLTLDCARCHDHKIDPLPTTDYYRFLAFFHNLKPYSRNPENILSVIANDEERANHDAELEEHQRILADLANQLAPLDATIFASLSPERRRQIERFGDPIRRRNETSSHAEASLNSEDFKRYRELSGEQLRLLRQGVAPLTKALAARERGPKAPETFVLIRGSAHARGQLVQPGFPEVLGVPDPVIPEPDPDAKTSGRRTLLANWIASKENPLTSRVMVNRIWQHHFGRGLVATPNNFGTMGAPPTHPGLLDWLASELVRGGWRLKPIHRLIVTSKTYRMSSQVDSATWELDPNNDLLARFSMRRLSAEELRDSILSVDGSLNLQMGGPGIYPTIPPAYLAGQSRPGAGWGRSSPEQQARRSIYIHVKRSLPVPLLASFDMAEVDISCPVRFTTTQSTQALNLLNSTFMNESAQRLANRLIAEVGSQTDAMARRALHLVTGRVPSESEVDRCCELVERLRADGLDQGTAHKYLCLMALNLNEFLYLD